MFFEGAFCRFSAASVTYIRRFLKILTDGWFITVAVVIAQAAEPAFVDIPPVPAVRTDICPGAGEAVGTVIVTMSQASGSRDRMVPFHLPGDGCAVLLDHTADRLKRKMFRK